ncbi:MAG: tetratricopeptide repeat protein [Firmicutes bacterium]|nr:tetratricopeptide repeat protein [Bacillota bacterium]
MGNRNNKKKYQDIKDRNDLNERIDRYKSIKKIVNQANYSKALTEINDYMEQYPDDCFGKLLKGIILSDLKEFNQAKEVFQSLIDNEEKNQYTAMYQLGCIAKAEGNKELSKKYFEKVIEESPYEEDFSKIELSEIALEECDYKTAKKLILDVSDKFKDYSLLQLSKIELASGHVPEALNHIMKIKNIEKESFRRKVNLQKGRIEAANNNYEEALKYYNEVATGKKNKIYWSAKLEEGKLENHFMNYKRTLEICEELLNNNQTLDGEIYLLAGKTHENLGDYDNAEKYYKKARDNKDINKRDKGNYYLGMLKLITKEYDLAIKYFKKIEKNVFYKKIALLNTIYIEIRNNNYIEAEKNLNKLVEKNLLAKYSKEYKILSIIINKGLSKEIDNNDNNNYLEKQYINYDRDETIKHIKEIQFNEESKNVSNFMPSTDIELLMTEVEKKLTPDKLQKIELVDIYYLDYENIGYAMTGEQANKLKVVVIPNTKQIINMYPIYDDKNKIEEKPKVKRLSQIEKFNKKYNLK